MRTGICALLCLGLMACKSAERPAASGTKPEPLLQTQAPWDEKPGRDTITLDPDGTLRAGRSIGQAQIRKPSDYFFKEQARIEVVNLGHPDYPRAILVSLPRSNEDEDPPNLYQLFVEDQNRLQRILNQEVGSYGVIPLRFDGDGTVKYEEDGYTACGRLGPNVRAREAQPATVTLALVDGAMKETGRVPLGTTQKCDELPG